MEQTPGHGDRRLAALGHLRVLPDELICAILEYLSPIDLGRLSCVSSVLYILCNEEPLWMNLCLRDGGMFEYRGSWKRTSLYGQKLCNKIEEFQRQQLPFDGFSSLFFYRRWYRCFTTLDGFSFDNNDLERKNNSALEESNYKIDEKKPVILTEVANTWPAKHTWTIDQLLSNYGDLIFRISQRGSKKITMKLKDYVSYMKCQHDEDPLYVFDDKFGEAAPALLRDYCVPSLFQEDFFDVLDNDLRPPFRWLIIGPERSGASWHVDPGLTSAWNSLLCGRKRWALYPPGRVPAGVTVHVSEDDGDVNIESPSSLQWWLDIYPLLADQDKPLECTQLPGETIFIPSGWWHCVLNLDTTIAVTQNFVNASNFEFVCLDMAPGHVHKGVCRAGLLALQKGSELSKSEASFEMNLLNYPDMSRREKRLKALKSDKEQQGYHNSWNSITGFSETYKNCNQGFSYDINLLSTFMDKEIDHYNTIFSPSNILGEREMRAWLHKLWVVKPAMRKLIWKGACLTLNVEKWSSCLVEICKIYNLPSPLDDEKFPVGTGSNPVFLVFDNVIKIFADWDLGFSVRGLGTELELYSLLAKTKSPLMDHVPDIIASGLVVFDNSEYKIFPWDGRGVPDIITNISFVTGDPTLYEFPFGVWSKMQFELENNRRNMRSRIWPFIVSRRCKGDIYANLRDMLSKNDVLNLASFLGEQLRHFHLLPLPKIQTYVKGISMVRKVNECSIRQCKLPPEFTQMDADCHGVDTSQEWKIVIAALNRRKSNIKNQLFQWGHPIPRDLVDVVENYLPHDFSRLLGTSKDDGGSFKYISSPTWIHSDIMEDNIFMKQGCFTDCFYEYYSHTRLKVNDSYDGCDHAVTASTMNGYNVSCDGKDAVLMINGTLHTNGELNLRRWCPSHILDFSDLSVGDPLRDLVPIYLDVFRGETSLLHRLLENYKIPLAIKRFNDDDGAAENGKFSRLSYRAMCLCILHKDNVLGAIFSLWKELRSAKSWEEVEEAVWGELNSYRPSNNL